MKLLYSSLIHLFKIHFSHLMIYNTRKDKHLFNSYVCRMSNIEWDLFYM